MTELVSDDLLERCVIVALYDDLAATIKQRYDNLIQRIEVSIPVVTNSDLEQLGEIVAGLQST